MDFLAFLRTMGSLGAVLGLLWGALWLVRRYNIKLPGSLGAAPERRLAVVERIGIDTRRSVALIRRDGREHLLLIAPEGNLVIESAIVRDEIDRAAAEAQAQEAEARAAAAQAAAAQAQASFQELVSKVIDRSGKSQAKLPSGPAPVSDEPGDEPQASTKRPPALLKVTDADGNVIVPGAPHA